MDMFELKYTLTGGDVKAINKRYMLFYFVLYLAVALVGIAIGIVAIVLSPQKLMFVLGIILLVLGAILLVCALMLLVAPKNFLISAIKPDNGEIGIKVDESGIKVTVGEDSKHIPFCDVRGTKVKKDLLFVYIAKDVAIIIKNAIVSGGSFDELCKFAYARQRGVTNPVLAKKQNTAQDSGAENMRDENSENNKEKDEEQSKDE